jgi:hypothetical protein
LSTVCVRGYVPLSIAPSLSFLTPLPVPARQVGYNTTYMPVLRAALDAGGFSETRIIAADMFSGQWEIANDVAASPALQAAVHTIGVHYPGSQSTPVAQVLKCERRLLLT